MDGIRNGINHVVNWANKGAENIREKLDKVDSSVYSLKMPLLGKRFNPKRTIGDLRCKVVTSLNSTVKRAQAAFNNQFPKQKMPTSLEDFPKDKIKARLMEVHSTLMKKTVKAEKLDKGISAEQFSDHDDYTLQALEDSLEAPSDGSEFEYKSKEKFNLHDLVSGSSNLNIEDEKTIIDNAKQKVLNAFLKEIKSNKLLREYFAIQLSNGIGRDALVDQFIDDYIQVAVGRITGDSFSEDLKYLIGLIRANKNGEMDKIENELFSKSIDKHSGAISSKILNPMSRDTVRNAWDTGLHEFNENPKEFIKGDFWLSAKGYAEANYARELYDLIELILDESATGEIVKAELTKVDSPYNLSGSFNDEIMEFLAHEQFDAEKLAKLIVNKEWQSLKTGLGE